MKTLRVFVLGLLLFPATAFAQKYMCVQEPVKFYLDIKDSEEVKAKSVGEVYHSQIVKVRGFGETLGMAYIETLDYEGFIPQNKLIDIPAGYHTQITKIWRNGDIFIVANECPEIVLCISSSDYAKSFVAGGMQIKAKSLYVKDLETGKMLDYATAIPYTVTFYPKRTLLTNEYYCYAFYLNNKNFPVRNVIPFHSRITNVSEAEKQSVLQTAEDAYRAAKAVEGSVESTNNTSFVSTEIAKYIGSDNFTFLSKLGQLYIDGNSLAEKYYPLLSSYYPVDKKSKVVLDAYIAKIWGLKNKGEIAIN